MKFWVRVGLPQPAPFKSASESVGQAYSADDAGPRLGYRGAMQAYFLVFLGAGSAAVCGTPPILSRRGCSGPIFPWGTFLINISGSAIMGLLAGFLAFRTGANWTQHARLFLLTGVLGGYTTFSAYSLDSALLLERGAYVMTAAYVGGSVFLALAGVFGGLFVARALS